MREIETILAIREMFPVSPRQRNAVLTCDAELVELGREVYGLSMDEFSAEEDFFPGTDPEGLGRNLAVAVTADILAAGCLPELYMHAIVEPLEQEEFSVKLCRGVKTVLEEYGCFLLGGDMGKTRETGGWRYTGLALGKPADGAEPLTRVLPPGAQAIWITGTVGDGNCCALSGRMPLFEPRLAEARTFWGKARACMDTSGGLVESLLLLGRLNPSHRFAIDPEAIPYDEHAAEAARAGEVPVEGFAFGGAGEYELLFTTDEAVSMTCATRIGTARPTRGGFEESGVFWNGRKLPAALRDARSFKSLQEYVEYLLQAVKSCLP